MEAVLEQRPTRTGDNFVLVDSGSPTGKRVGIYGKGSCDMKLLYAIAPLIRPHLKGSVCIKTEGTAADSRSDSLLQILDDPPQDRIDEVVNRLGVAPDFFRTELYEPTLTVPNVTGDGLEEFPKTVVCLSIAPDVNRVVYRHRVDGLLVDPGGGWLNQSLEVVMGDPQVVQWFRQSFQSTGRLSVEQFVGNFTRLIRLVQRSTGAQILVFNTLVVDPGSLMHNYQFAKQCHSLRRREFQIALADLSRALDFSIIDVDRVLKQAGVRTQIDYGHPTPVYNVFIAREIVRILRERGIF
jgi:hypothetical protein